MTDPEQLLAHPANARRHPGKQRDALRASLDKAGWVSPVIVNRKTGRVLDGHARVEEAITRGVQVPVAYVTVTEDKESYILATFDAVGSMAEFDQQALTDLLLEIETTGADELDKTLAYIADIDLEALDKLQLEEPDFVLEDDLDDSEPPEPPIEPKTSMGDVWTLGSSTLVCGDATNETIYAKALAGKTIGAVWTDPPYGVSYTAARVEQPRKIENDRLDEEPLSRLLSQAFSNTNKFCEDGATWWVASPPGGTSSIFMEALKEKEILRQCLVWVKDQFVLGRSDYHYQHELLLYGWKPGATHTEPADRKQTSLLHFDRPRINKHHPTMKPVKLISYCLSHSSPGLVFDPFSGSGSTLLAALDQRRDFAGIELDPKYCDVIAARFQEATSIIPKLNGTPVDMGEPATPIAGQ